MSKRLIVALAFVMAVGMTCAAYAEVQNVKVSGDITALGVDRTFNMDRGIKDNGELSGFASIARVKVDADLTDNVMTTVRLLNERWWGTQLENTGADSVNTNVLLDLASVTLKEFLYSPLTVTVGRQELHYGSEMIVGDAGPSTETAFGGNQNIHDLVIRPFDAVRATLNYDPLTIDMVMAKVAERTKMQNDDTTLNGIFATYKLGKKDTTLEGYWFGKNTGRENTVASIGVKKQARTDVIGGRIVTHPLDALTYSLEAAYQFGKYVPTAANMHTVERKAWALETSAGYDFKNLKYVPTLTGMYMYFSGDHENNAYTTDRGAYKGWDPMYENQKAGHITNALFSQTNLHILGAVATAKPMDSVMLKGEYYAYWWAKAFPEGATTPTAWNTGASLVTTERKFAGQEVDVTAIYNYTEDVQFSLLGGLYFPGPSFAKGNNSTCKEVLGTMKVTF